MNKNTKNTVIMVIMIAFMVAIVLLAYKSTDVKNIASQSYELADGWDVVVNGTEYKDANLNSLTFSMCGKGDTVTYTTIIPQEDEMEDASLMFYSVHSVVDVYLDGEQIYSYGHELADGGQMLGYGKQFIELPEDYGGKTLTICLQVTENNAFEGQQAPVILNKGDYIMTELAGRRVSLAVTFSLIIFGVLVFIISILRLHNSQEFLGTCCIAMFSFFIGCWNLCNSDLITYFIGDLQVKARLEYLTLYVAMLPFTYYFKGHVLESDVPRHVKRIYMCFIYGEIIYVVSAIVLNYFDLVHYPSFLTGIHLIMIVVMLFVVVFYLNEIRLGHRENSSIVIGFGVGIGMALMEIVRFNFGKYILGFSENKYSSSLALAMLALVVSMFVDFTKRVSSALVNQAQNEVLLKMAYMDELTGLANRRKCDIQMEEYNNSSTPYLVVSFDLNHLKKVNDTLGHEAGDAMIKEFSEVLKGVFKEKGTLGRMGGDEFVAILGETSRRQAEELLNQLEDAIREHNQEEKPYSLSVAYGIAASSEVRREEFADKHIVYKIADNRMYERKMFMKRAGLCMDRV